MKIRGMRHIPTIQGLAHRGVAATREQTVGDLVRQEHERARLQRELGLWNGKKEATEQRLQSVEERIKALEQILYESLDSRPAEDKPGETPEDDAKRGFREVKIEY